MRKTVLAWFILAFLAMPSTAYAASEGRSFDPSRWNGSGAVRMPSNPLTDRKTTPARGTFRTDAGGCPKGRAGYDIRLKHNIKHAPDTTLGAHLNVTYCEGGRSRSVSLPRGNIYFEGYPDYWPQQSTSAWVTVTW